MQIDLGLSQGLLLYLPGGKTLIHGYDYTQSQVCLQHDEAYLSWLSFS